MPTAPKKTIRPWVSKPKHQNERQNNSGGFYHTTRWRNLRKKFIQVNPLCIECKKFGNINAANVVDHIKPINEGGKQFDWNNLQSLCSFHHDQKRGKESFEKRGKG